MRARQAVASGVVVLVAAVMIAAPVVGGALPSAEFQTGDSGESGGEFGDQVASFAQASAVDANETVDRGMWRAAFNDSENPSQAVAARTGTLERRLERLESQSETLRAQRENGTISEAAYTARASALRVRMANLRRAIEESETVARQTGVNTTKLDRLRSEAANMTGPEVAELARQIADPPRGPPDDVPGEGGPPDDTGPPDNGPATNESESGSPDGGDGGPGASDERGGQGQGDGADSDSDGDDGDGSNRGGGDGGGSGGGGGQGGGQN